MSILIRLLLLTLLASFCISQEQETEIVFLGNDALAPLFYQDPAISFADTSGDIINVKCFFVKGYDVYTFEKLQNKTEDYSLSNEAVVVKYNFCQNTKDSCPQGNSTLIRKITEGGTQKCTRLTGTIDGSKNDKLYNQWTPYNEGGKQGVKLKFIEGDQCEFDATKKYSITYDVECLPGGEDTKITLELSQLTGKTLTGCDYTIKGQSKAACPYLNYYIVQAFFEKYSSFLGAIIILVGILFLTLGVKFIYATIVLTTSLGMALILFLIVFNIFTISEYKYVWIVLGVGLGVGCLIGFFLLKILKVCYFVIGGCFGYTVGVFVSTFILEWVSWNPEILYWIIIAGCIIGFGLLTMWIVKHALIIATSFIGAYLMCRGIAVYAGGFPNEQAIIDLIKKKEWDKLDEYRTPYVYGYLAGIVVLFGCGIACQEKINKDKDNSHYTKMKD